MIKRIKCSVCKKRYVAQDTWKVGRELTECFTCNNALKFAELTTEAINSVFRGKRVPAEAKIIIL